MTIDFRTDSGTQPTEEMRQAMYEAVLGDDYYGEDPTVNLLEKTAAEMLGKEAALLTTTATLGNQLALLSTAAPESDIWIEEHSHIATHDYTTFLFPRARFHTYLSGNGMEIKDTDLEASCTTPNSVFCLENTHNRHGGTILPLSEMKKVYEQIRKKGGRVHLDGARLFNASVATKIPLREFARYADTVVVCLCKGLCAPTGAILAGPEQTIKKARNWRKRMGSGMPQAGIIAAPGYVGLKKMIPRLAEDHLLAKKLAQGLAQLPDLNVDLSLVQTNIVLVHPSHPKLSAEKITDELKKAGILVLMLDSRTIRFVTDRNIHSEDISKTVEVMNHLLNGWKTC
ncbi:aminotransferase class I/II-fold pyridoxal phosphate-dependent enzyme [Sporolactobacillus sp. THM7-4]|nr:aminotransferase class I/II-fold pyridoxal phosphate-dependent enzyme [Sporolactobacillus sp. THM7-4]